MRAPAPRRLVVLLLQPEQDDRTMYLQFLHHEGIATLCPRDAMHALSMAPKADVIVTGILLPGPIDGIEFIIRLRADEGTKHIPVVVLTGEKVRQNVKAGRGVAYEHIYTISWAATGSPLPRPACLEPSLQPLSGAEVRRAR
jgi:CheY-like chemotaxis protein